MDELIISYVNPNMAPRRARVEQHQITAILATDDAGRLAGVVHMHDLLKAGVV